jgi:hypothetical protein
LCVNAQAKVKEFYVSPTGNDNAKGTRKAPFASFEHARAKVQAYKSSNPKDEIVVFFRGGKYYLTAPVVFMADDSGTESAPITYKAYGDEVPEILGGEKLTGLSWTKVDDHIYKTKVPDGLVFETLFVNGQQMVLARYPNYDENAEVFGGTAADCIDSSRVAGWANPTGGYVHALHGNRWGGIHYRITGKDNSNKLKLEGGTQNNRGRGMHRTYRFVENIFEELDAENEWFLNRETSELYFYPKAGLDLDNAELEYAALEQLIVFKGSMDNPVKYITVEGMQLKRTIRTFMKTAEPLLRSDWTIYRGGVVNFEGTENCALVDCALSLLGGNAVFFNNYNKYSKVTGCHMHDIGAGGVCFVGDSSAIRNYNTNVGYVFDLDKLDFTRGPKNNNYPQYCTVDNNLIHRIGLIEKQVAGVQISMSAYITVSRNSIYDVPRAGINISEGTWSGHIIEFNDVFKTVLETEDHGAFNSWGRDRFYSKNRGVTEARVAANKDIILLDILAPTIIRNNRFRCDHGWDIDLDDGSSNYHIYNNICLSGGIKLRDGYYRTAENNILINNSMNVHVWLKNSGDVIKRNICTKKYIPIGMGNWGSEIDSNLFYLKEDLEYVQQVHGTDKHSVFGDPEFVDPANGNYTVKEGSLAYQIGWVNIPDSFGVQVPKLKAIAEIPEFPEIELTPDVVIPGVDYMGGIIKNIETDGELSAAGLGEKEGVMIMKAPYKWIFARLKLLDSDVILKLDDEKVANVDDFIKKMNGDKVYSKISIWRYQDLVVLDMPDITDCTIPVKLNPAAWKLVSVSSEAAPDYSAKFAFDNNINSFWHTEFTPKELAPPHELVVDMGASYVLESMEFLARQGSSHPRIKEFKLYLSPDLNNWGEPILEGTLKILKICKVSKLKSPIKGGILSLSDYRGIPGMRHLWLRLIFTAGVAINSRMLV